jgi:beta-fructofuranosidase
MCECPDLFRIGSWWYLLFSTFTDRRVTHYRMARSLEGPWLAPADDALDGPAWYAGKTASDGKRRFAFGWLSHRQGDEDDGAWGWGGPLVVHQLEQRRDGSLAVRAPDSVLRAFPLEVAATPEPVLGAWADADRETRCDSPGRWSATRWSDLPDTALVELEFTFERGTQEAGLLLRMDRALERYYQLRFEPARQRMTLDRWPRAPGNPAFLAERPLALAPGKTVTLRLVADGPCVVVYANDEIAFSGRLCQGRAGGGLGFFVAEGAARFRRIRVRRPKTLWE